MDRNYKELLNELLEGKVKVAVVGLGYVGLPLALEFARFVDVVGVLSQTDTELKGGYMPEFFTGR